MHKSTIIVYDSYYVVIPIIRFSHVIDYKINLLEQIKKYIGIGFEYHSINNTEWLTKEELLVTKQSI